MAQLTFKDINQDFVKLRHLSLVFTPTNIAAMQKALDLSDLVSLVFLMCANDQIKNMYELLQTVGHTGVASLDLYGLFQKFTSWEQKLPQALVAIKNQLALWKLGMSPTDIQHNRIMKDSELALCPTRVALYRIVDELPVREDDGNNLVSKMVELGAPQPPNGCPQLETISHSELLHFMFWHSKGFLDIERGDNFEMMAESLIAIGKGDLADYFIPPQALHDSYVFDDHNLGVYQVKNSNNPGLCIIINQVCYGGKKTDRESSNVNVNDLIHLMKVLKFSVVSLKDLTGPEFCDKIKNAVANEFSKNHSIFILIIMSHGERDGVLCPSNQKTDDGNLGVVKIDNIQHSLFECQQLESIPKVILFNSCRGEWSFTNRHYFQMESDAPDSRETISHADIITCYSALPKFVSWRDSKTGSIFLRLFCDILTKRPDIEICELFTLMNARLMEPTADMSPAFTPGRQGYEHRLAMPFDFTSSLGKKLYFQLPETFRT